MDASASMEEQIQQQASSGIQVSTSSTSVAAPTSPPLKSPARKQVPFMSNSASVPISTSSNPNANAGMAPGGKVRLTKYPAIANALLPAEGNGTFSNLHLALLVIFFPAFLLRLIPFVKASWFPWWAYWTLALITGIPVTVAYWTIMSMYGPRKNDKVTLPGKPIEHYLNIKDSSLRKKYSGQNKIPMQVFHDAYFDNKIEIKEGITMLELLEYRLDWAHMHMTPELFRYVFLNLIPDVVMHTAKQDLEQVGDNYNRGNDFYEWFLGPQMIYTSGMISDLNKKETLEELQDNKLSVVCSKLNLQAGDRLLDIGCGWGTLSAFAAKNFDADVTGVTLAKEQAKFGNERISKNGISSEKARILCMDYRDIPVNNGHYNKIVSLEMAEHVGIRNYAGFLKNVYNLLDDDGTFVFQVAGLRPQWQFWDLIWGLFMNKYVFPGADASCSLGWVINQLENTGFEVRSADVLGVHYSATIQRWLENWISNEQKVKASYGERWYKIWLFFLASSTIIAREGGSSVFQITLTKNLNATHRVEGVTSHNNIHPKPPRQNQSVYH